MTVLELLDQLKNMPLDAIVVLTNDEGNQFLPIGAVSKGVYRPETSWYGEFFENDEVEDAQTPEQVAICLWSLA